MNRHALKLVESLECFETSEGGYDFVRKGDSRLENRVKYWVLNNHYLKWPGEVDNYDTEIGWIPLPERMKIVLKMVAFPEVLP